MEKSQIYFLVTLGVFVLATIFFLCGFGGPNWIEFDGDANFGLWKVCSESVCATIELTDDDFPDWFKATAAFMILAFIGVVVSGVSFLWLPVTAVCHCVAGGLTLLAIIIWGAKYKDTYEGSDLGWSFILATMSALMFLANGALMVFLALSSSCNMTRRPIPFIEGDKA